MKIERFEDVPLENLEFTMPEMRARHFRAYISQLAEMTAKQDFLQPIIVALTNETEKYEVVTGLDRYLAAIDPDTPPGARRRYGHIVRTPWLGMAALASKAA